MAIFQKMGCVLFGIALLCIGIPQIQTDSYYGSTLVVEGEFEKIFSMPLKNGRKEFKIFLKDHHSEYIIQDFIKPSFNLETFVNEVKWGQELTIHLDDHDSKMICQVFSNGKEYLSVSERNKGRIRNGWFAIGGGLLFIIIGLAIKF